MELLLNWLWQGCAIAAVVSSALWLAGRRLNAATRYQVRWAALLVILLIPWVPTPAGTADPSGLAFSTDPLEPATIVATVPAWPGPLLLACWIAWVSVRGARGLGAIRAVRRARRACRPFPAAREGRLRRWCAVRSRGRSARLAISDVVGLAGVLGAGSPVIAVSRTALDGLSDSELDRVLIHEWAHVQRRDDLARVLELAIDALAGLHPAIWWVSRGLDVDREVACDDWTVALTGSARDYAACLLRLAELPAARRHLAAVPAALSTRKLETRLRLLVDSARNASPGCSRFLLAAALPCMLLLAVAAARADVVAEASPFRDVPATPGARRAPIGAPLPALSAATARAAPAGPSRLVPDEPRPRLEPPRRELVDEASRGARPASNPDGPTAYDTLPAVQAVPVATWNAVPAIEFRAPEVVRDSLPGRAPSATAAGAEDGPTPAWSAAAGAGLAVGRGSQKAALATAGFFSRAGKRIAASF